MDKLMMKEYMDLKYGGAKMEEILWERSDSIREAEKRYEDDLKSIMKDLGAEMTLEMKDRLWGALADWRLLELEEAYLLGAEDRERMLR